MAFLNLKKNYLKFIFSNANERNFLSEKNKFFLKNVFKTKKEEKRKFLGNSLFSNYFVKPSFLKFSSFSSYFCLFSSFSCFSSSSSSFSSFSSSSSSSSPSSSPSSSSSSSSSFSVSPPEGFVYFDEEKEKIEYDVLIVGGGVAGLSAAIKLKQLCKNYISEKIKNEEEEEVIENIKKENDISICVIEKGKEIGSHILSGNVFDVKTFFELFPDCKSLEDDNYEFLSEWENRVKVREDEFYFLTKKKSFLIPKFLIPSELKNKNNFIISAGDFTKNFLQNHAEKMGVDIFPGFPGEKMILDEKEKKVIGVKIKDFGIDKQNKKKTNFQIGIQILAKQILLADGCRGNLSENVISFFDLRKNSICPPQYGIGIKEIWSIEKEKHREGLVLHTVGFPLKSNIYGGSFIYHMKNNLIYIGIVIGLDYQNPYINPYEEFQLLKSHPLVSEMLNGNSNLISYGAKCLNEGGIQAIPKLTFPGGMLIGCSGGFLNIAKIKGLHLAMKSAIESAKCIFDFFLNKKNKNKFGVEIVEYQKNIKKTFLWEELHKARNVKGGFKNFGLYFGMLNAYICLNLTKGKEPFTYKWKLNNSQQTKQKHLFQPILYPKHNGKTTFDIMQSLSFSGTNHDHDQPSHLIVKENHLQTPTEISLKLYAAPETRFCPAQVYEFVEDVKTKKMKLQINAQNCLHCKCCSIKSPCEYINWSVPNGGEGPNYVNM